MTIEVFAPAKINLTLHVTGQRADGYHLLDSLVVFADVGDRIWFTPQGDMSLDVTGPFAAGVPADARNLVWKAADLAGRTGHIVLEKNLPHGAGIGGGSSDAGALLRALGCEDDGAALGADVAVCRLGRAALMSGIGDQIAPVDGFDPMFAVLVNPGAHVPTPAVFSALADKTNPPMPSQVPKAGDLAAWLAEQRNDLEAPAIAQAPVIADVLAVLQAQDAQYLTRMSGSGSTCFALFHTQERAQNAAKQIAQAHPEWWVKDCVLS